MHAGWGKVSTAGACQFAIDAFQPQLMVNLGTCGGLEGLAELGKSYVLAKQPSMISLKAWQTMRKL